MRKFVILGANGMLGTDLLTACKSIYDIDVRGLLHTPEHSDLDITRLDAVSRVIGSLSPDVVLHCAAHTDVDGCELDPDKAYQINALGTRNVALACRKSGAALVYFSTDYVFDGQRSEPYREWDPICPVSHYGSSKRLGEDFVRQLCPRHYILRTAWLYGRNGKNFVDTISRLARERGQVRVVNDQIGCPTWTCDLAEKTLELIESERFGTFHVTNSGSCSWYEFACAVVGYQGIASKVEPIATDQYPRPARRPAHSVLDNYFLRLEGLRPLRPWREALQAYLATQQSDKIE